jgi:outer membrane protein insertion porin family
MRREGLVLMSRFTDGFRLSGRSCFPAVIFIIFLVFAFNTLVFCQEPSKKENFIHRVQVELDGKSAESEIAELVTVKPGDIFSVFRISEIVKHLYNTGLFSDVQVEKEGEGQVDLKFILESQPYVRSIIFQGSLQINSVKLKQELTEVKEGEIFYEESLDKAAEQLKDLLRERGKFDPNIEATIESTDEPSLVDVIFKIQALKEYVVKEILFRGDVVIPEPKLEKEMDTQVGKPFMNSMLEQDIENLKDFYSSLGYQRVEVKVLKEFHKEDDYVSLILEIEAHEKIEIIIQGADVPVSLLRPIWEANIFVDWGVEQGRTKIIKYMQKKGYLFSNVRGSAVREENEIRVLYKVFPGEKYKISDIVFKRSEYFSPDELKSHLAIRENAPLLSSLTGDRLFELPSEIESLYETHGFPHARVTPNFKKSENKVEAVFFIEEGIQNIIKEISFKGAKNVTSEQLSGIIETFKGGPFYQPRIQRDIESLENFYLNMGYRRTEIQANIDKAGENSFEIEFEIEEGERVRVKNVIIAGNKITRRKIILREISVQSGDYAYYDEIRRTKRNLESLGIFSKVTIEEVPLDPGWENVLISVREGKRNYVSLGIGLETKNEPRSFQAWNSIIRPRGTAELIRGNIFGTGAQLSAVGQISLKEKRGVISWEQPYFFGILADTYLNAWLERESRKSYSFDRRGISLSAIKPIAKDENRIFIVTLRFARTSLFELKVSESEVDRQFFPFSATSISGSIIWDKRNDSFNPEKGYFASTVLEWAYPLFQAESDYLKLFTKYQQFFQLAPGVAFSLTSRLGLGMGRMPIHERFFAGGSNSFRGTSFDELGPKDPMSLEPVGGKALVLVNFELSFPLLSYLKDLYGTVFYDKGNVFFKRSQFDFAELQDAVGAGLRYKTPLGPIRVELGWNFDAPEGKKQPLLIIAIGHVF